MSQGVPYAFTLALKKLIVYFGNNGEIRRERNHSMRIQFGFEFSVLGHWITQIFASQNSCF